MSTDPFDPDNSFLKIDRHNEPVIVALDIEDDPVGSYDTGRRVQTLHIRCPGPSCLAHLVEPSVKRRLQRALVFVARSGLDEFTKCPAGNNAHKETLPRAHFGHKMQNMNLQGIPKPIGSCRPERSRRIPAAQKQNRHPGPDTRGSPSFQARPQAATRNPGGEDWIPAYAGMTDGDAPMDKTGNPGAVETRDLASLH